MIMSFPEMSFTISNGQIAIKSGLKESGKKFLKTNVPESQCPSQSLRSLQMVTQTSPAPLHSLALSEGRGDGWFSSQVLRCFLVRKSLVAAKSGGLPDPNNAHANVP